MSNKKVIGLDLGTGNSAVAIIEANKAKVIENADGYKTTPSVVYIKGDETKIGAAAKRGMVMNPKIPFHLSNVLWVQNGMIQMYRKC